MQQVHKVESIDPLLAYPHKFATTCRIPEYVEKHGSLAEGADNKDVTERVCGMWMGGHWDSEAIETGGNQ